MHKRSWLYSVAIIAMIVSSPAISSDLINSPVKAITLSSGGLAEIQRTTKLNGNGEIKIEVPINQVNDILKSLVVFDPNGTVKDLSLAGPSPVKETFGNMPFTPNDLTSLPNLLMSLRGAEVVISGQNSGGGKILGVEHQQGKEQENLSILNILDSNNQIKRYELKSDTSVEFVDSDIQEKIATALGVIGDNSSDTSRNIIVKINGAGERNVDFSYVIAAPIWKTSYRVVVGSEGEARLQAWAVFENATGEDWEDVSITLNSNSPVTLTQKLHDRYWKKRNELPVTVDNVGIPHQDTGNVSIGMQSEEMAHGLSADMMKLSSVPQPMMASRVANNERAEMSYAQNATSSEGDLSAKFELDGSYDIRNGDTVSIPIVDELVTAELISLFRPDRGSRHPIAAVSMDNTTGVSLPGGILTVYDEKGEYVGDSSLLGLPSGEKRMSSFALDKKVTVDIKTSRNNRYTEIKVSDGILTAKSIQSEMTTYFVKGALDGDRTVIIEHPKREGWKFASNKLKSESASDYRLRVDIAEGESELVKAIITRDGRETYQLTHLDPALILQWSKSAADRKTRKKLEQLSKIKREEFQINRQLESVVLESSNLKQSQQRTRENIAAVNSGSDTQKEYVKKLNTLERQIESNEKKQADLRAELFSLRTDINDFIRSF